VATSPDEAKRVLLDAAVAGIREQVGAEAADFELFVRAYYAHVAPEDLADRSEVDLYGAALAHWNLARVRQPGEIKLRVYTPNVEEHGW
jgi:glutamate dehydrogenase